MESPDPRRRLLELSEDRGVSLASLSRMLGKNASYLQQFVRKGSPRKLEETDRAKLARFLEVSEDELGAPQEKSHGSAASSGKTNWVDVPRLIVGASAGPGILGEEEQAFDVIRFSRRWLHALGLDAKMVSTIEVRGDSMEPTLRDGDEILVDRSARPVRDGIWVVRLEDTILVKRVETGRPGLIVLRSDNPVYRPIECRSDEVMLLGRAVWKGGRI